MLISPLDILVKRNIIKNMKNKKLSVGQAVRQGDILYLAIDKLPQGLSETKTDTILQNGSGGNPHTFKGGKFYAKVEGDFVIGYLKAKDTRIMHVEHGPKIGFSLPDGYYQVLRQSEETINGLKQVQD